MEALQWMLQNSGETLLLVAVDASAADHPGAYPCRVVGTFSAWAQSHAALDDAARISRLLSEIGVWGKDVNRVYRADENVDYYDGE